ncbi:MAG: redoxin domain-containing protein [Dehalococcoidia bacterium]|nr:MAG: redoxin domain-containing protein [Dehalococcoidia bacterium]
MCRGEICVPLPADRAASVVVERDGATWVDVAGFAGYIKQTSAHDEVTGTWYFGPGPEEHRGQFQLLDAPDFELPDLDGRKHRLSDYRGKKVLLALWASW